MTKIDYSGNRESEEDRRYRIAQIVEERIGQLKAGLSRLDPEDIIRKRSKRYANGRGGSIRCPRDSVHYRAKTLSK